MKNPVWPDDFVRESAEGGVSFWWWSPDGRPCHVEAGEDFPNGLMIGDEETTDANLVDGCTVIAWWCWGDTDGPSDRETYNQYDPACVQRLIERVMRMVREEKETQ